MCTEHLDLFHVCNHLELLATETAVLVDEKIKLLPVWIYTHLRGWVVESESPRKDCGQASGLVCRPQHLRCEEAGQLSPGSMWSLVRYIQRWFKHEGVLTCITLLYLLNLSWILKTSALCIDSYSSFKHPYTKKEQQQQMT